MLRTGCYSVDSCNLLRMTYNLKDLHAMRSEVLVL